MNPLEWLKNKFSGTAPKGGAIVPKGGAIVPVKPGQLRAPTTSLVGGPQQITTNMNVPTPGRGIGAGLGVAAAQSVGLAGAEALARTAGRPNQSRFSMFGADFKGDAPVYATPFNQDPITSASSGKTRVGGVTYDLSIPEHKKKYDAVIAADQATRPGQQFHDLRGGGGLKTDGSRFAAPPRGRVTTEKTNSNGVVQKGTQMTPSTLGDIGNMYDRVLDGTGLKSTRYNPFESVSLPSAGGSSSDAQVMGRSKADSKQIASGGAVETLIDGANITSTPQSNAIDQVSSEGAQKIVKSGAQKVTRGFNGHEFGGDHEAPATVKRDRTSKLRRQYMLDDNLTSMQALRAMRDAQGFDRHGDGYYAHGSAKPGDTTSATNISKEQYQQAIRSDEGAASVVKSLKDSYVAAAKDVQSPETTTNDYWNERTTKVDDSSAMSATTRQAIDLTAPGASFNKDGPADDNSEQIARDYLKIKKPFEG